MRRVCTISVLLLVAVVLVRGQVIDTSKNINTWMLKHNYTRFEEVPLDTNTHQLHHDYNPAYLQGYSYESVGVLGHGLNIILGLMAVVVHGIRLNMLEFSSHLDMQWSGKEYKPFRE